MANQYWVGSGADVWSDGTKWASGSGGGDETGPPANSDAVYFDANSRDCTMDEDSAALVVLIANAYNNTLDLADWTLDSGLLCRMTSDMTVVGPGTILWSGGGWYRCDNIPNNVIVNWNGSGAPGATVDLVTNHKPQWVVDAGVTMIFEVDIDYNLSGFTAGAASVLTLYNNVFRFKAPAAGTCTVDLDGNWNEVTGEWYFDCDADIEIVSACKAKELVLGDGVGRTFTLTDICYFKKASLNAAATLTCSGSKSFYSHTPGANDFLDMAGTVDLGISTSAYVASNRSNSGAIKGSIVTILGDDATLTQTGVVSASSDTRIYGSSNKYGKVVLGVTGCSFGAVQLGIGGASKNGRLDLGDGGYDVTMTSLAKDSDSGTNELDFGDSTITLSGEIDGTDITCTSRVGSSVVGGTITDVDLSASETLDATAGVTDGGGNVNVMFGEEMGTSDVIGGRVW